MTELACMKNKASRKTVTHVEHIELAATAANKTLDAGLLGLAAPGCYGPTPEYR